MNVRTFQQVAGEQGEIPMIPTFVNAAGKSVPLMVIHKGVCLQYTWHIKVPGKMRLSVTNTGYCHVVIMHNMIHEQNLSLTLRSLI